MKILSLSLHYLFDMFSSPYCKHWDSLLTTLLDEGDVIEVTEHGVEIKLKELLYFIRYTPNVSFFSCGELWGTRKFGSGKFDWKLVPDCDQRRPSFKNMLRVEKLCRLARGKKQEEKLITTEKFYKELGETL